MKSILDKISEGGNPLNESNPLSIKSKFARLNFYITLRKYGAKGVNRILYGSNLVRSGDDLLKEYLMPKKLEEKESFAEKALENSQVLETLSQNFQSKISSQIKNYLKTLELKDRKIDSLIEKYDGYQDESEKFEGCNKTRTKFQKIGDFLNGLMERFSYKIMYRNYVDESSDMSEKKKNEILCQVLKNKEKRVKKDIKCEVRSFKLVKRRLEDLYEIQSRFQKFEQKASSNKSFYEGYLDALRVGSENLATA